MVQVSDLQDIFTYHKPTEAQVVQMETIRVKGKELAEVLICNVPPGPRRDDLILAVSNITMAANRSIILGGKL